MASIETVKVQPNKIRFESAGPPGELRLLSCIRRASRSYTRRREEGRVVAHKPAKQEVSEVTEAINDTIQDNTIVRWGCRDGFAQPDSISEQLLKDKLPIIKNVSSIGLDYICWR